VTHAARKDITPGRSRTSDKISNGTKMLDGVDMRSAAGRRFRHLVDAYSAELGADLSEAELSLIRQAVGLQLLAERLQGQIVNGDAVDSDALIRLSSTSKRLLSIIASRTGQRQAASGQDPLAAHIAAKYGHRSDASPEVDTEDDESEESDAAQEIEAAAE
jgi:hypothetical protein